MFNFCRTAGDFFYKLTTLSKMSYSYNNNNVQSAETEMLNKTTESQKKIIPKTFTRTMHQNAAMYMQIKTVVHPSAHKKNTSTNSSQQIPMKMMTNIRGQSVRGGQGQVISLV